MKDVTSSGNWELLSDRDGLWKHLKMVFYDSHSSWQSDCFRLPNIIKLSSSVREISVLKKFDTQSLGMLLTRKCHKSFNRLPAHTFRKFFSFLVNFAFMPWLGNFFHTSSSSSSCLGLVVQANVLQKMIFQEVQAGNICCLPIATFR